MKSVPGPLPVRGALLVLLLLAQAAVSAQWLNQPVPGTPRTKDGKANLQARTPKTRDGKPDLSGIWIAEPDPNGHAEGVENAVNPRYFVNIGADGKLEDVPLQPSADALFKQRLQNDGKEDPITRCQPAGTVAYVNFPTPFKIIQTPGVVAILYEADTTFRQVFTDGRTLPKDPQPSWMGYSVGKWEGDTFVVESSGFKDRGWLDRMGHPHSDALRLIERYRRRDFGHLDIQVTIDDPKTYTRPLVYTQHAMLLPDTDLIEYFCSENEKDTSHFK